MLQPVDYFEQVVKKSDGHAKRNILAEQDRIAATIPVKKPKAHTPASKPASVQPTKAQMLHTQSSSIAALSENYSSIRETQQELLRHKADLAKLEKLKQALSLGLIEQHEFNKRAAALLEV